MKKFLKVITAAVLSLGILSGISFTPQGIAHTENTAYAKIAPLRVTSTHLTVRRGQYAYFTVEGKRSSEGYATVYYKSGKSRSQTLGYKKSNSKGYATWCWKVGTRTTRGTWKVYVDLGGQTKYLYLHVG